MRFELLYFDGCPTYRNAEEDLRRVLAEEGVEATVELVEVNSNEEARRLRFPGSPTVRIDGRDPFPVSERGEGSLACRVYATPKGTPTAAMIREALGSGNEELPERKPLTPGDEEPVELGGVFGLPFRTLLSREVRRFVRVWTQTLLTPLLTSALYILVFGYGLGSRIREAAGIPYLEFILPRPDPDERHHLRLRQHLDQPLRHQARPLHRRRAHQPHDAAPDGPGSRSRRRGAGAVRGRGHVRPGDAAS